MKIRHTAAITTLTALCCLSETAWAQNPIESSIFSTDELLTGLVLTAALLFGVALVSLTLVIIQRRNTSTTPPQVPGTLEDLAGMESAENLLSMVIEAPTDRLDTSIGSMLCPDCQTLYDIGARFCPQHGTPLQEVEIDPAMVTSGDGQDFICPECDKHFQGEGAFCPEDGARLMPTDEQFQCFVPVPVMFCAERCIEMPPGLIRPVGMPVPVPILGRRSCGLPISGPGPKRHICPECGTRYPLTASFCALDQAKLVNLN